MTKRLMTLAAAVALTAGIARAMDPERELAEALIHGGQIASAAPKAPACWERADDEIADRLGLPAVVCFRSLEAFDQTPREAFTNSYSESACGDAASGSLKISAPNGAQGELKVEASIESTSDRCHSRRRSRVITYSKR